MIRKGLSKLEVKKIILNKVKSNPDIYYYIDNDFIEELVNLISDGVGEAIEVNNRKFLDDYEREKKRDARINRMFRQ